jgi:hypothetical protein
MSRGRSRRTLTLRSYDPFTTYILALAKPLSMSRGRVDGMREEKVGPHRSSDP